MCKRCDNPEPSFSVSSKKLFDQIDKVALILEEEGVFNFEDTAEEKKDFLLPLMSHWSRGTTPEDLLEWTNGKNITLKFSIEAYDIATDGMRTAAHLRLARIFVSSDPNRHKDVDCDALSEILRNDLGIPVLS